MAVEVELIDFLEKAWDSFTKAASDLASGAVEVVMFIALTPLVFAFALWVVVQVVDLFVVLIGAVFDSTQSGMRTGAGLFSRFAAMVRSRSEDKRSRRLEDARHHGYLESSGGLVADPTPYKTREERQAYMSGFREAQRHRNVTHVER